MLRRLPRILRLGGGAAPTASSEASSVSTSCRRGVQTEAANAGGAGASSSSKAGSGAHSVLDEVAQARLRRIKSQLEATGELPVETPRSGAWQAVRYLWNAVLLGTAGAGAAATYYTYAYTSQELTDLVLRTRTDAAGAKPENTGLLSSVWCDAMERYLAFRKNMEARIKEYTDPATDKLLPDLPPQLRGHLITLVLDLDELLVFKEWSRQKGWSIFKRPGVAEFLLELGQYYEIVVYTDEPATYADPILNKLDPHRVVPYRLYRTDTQYKDGRHVRDLSKLNRDLTHVLMISAKPEAWEFQPENSLKLRPWHGETGDTGLIDLIPFLQFLATRRVRDVRDVVRSYDGVQDIPAAFKARLQEAAAHQKQAKRGFLAPR